MARKPAWKLPGNISKIKGHCCRISKALHSSRNIAVWKKIPDRRVTWNIKSYPSFWQRVIAMLGVTGPIHFNCVINPSLYETLADNLCISYVMVQTIISACLSVFYCFPISWGLDDTDVAKAFWAPAEKHFFLWSCFLPGNTSTSLRY